MEYDFDRGIMITYQGFDREMEESIKDIKFLLRLIENIGVKSRI